MSFFDAGFRFRDPWVFALLAVAAIALFLAARRERAPGGLLFSSVALLPRASGESWRARGRWLLVALRLAAVVLLVVALARPQLARAAEEIVSEGIDIVIVLDISSSMSSRDFGGVTKIDGVKAVIEKFLEGLRSDRVGVVIFSGEALILSPLTLDYQALWRIVEPIDGGEVLSGGTAIGTGLATGINVLRDSGAKSRIAILLTDGENNAGDIRPLDAARLAKLIGVRVYTIGALSGARTSSDERDLRTIATETGGQYYYAAEPEALAGIYREIQQLEKSRVGARTLADYDEMGVPFLALGALLLLLEVVLAASVLRRAP